MDDSTPKPFGQDNTLALTPENASQRLRYDETALATTHAMVQIEFKNAIDLGPILGEGGMGIVYLGRQAMPEREVAVKKAKHTGDHLETMLLHEALITGMLEHPNIVPVHEIKQSEDRAIEVVMKRIKGVTLDAFMKENREQPGTLERALEALIQTSNALAFAHDRKIVHRDIKTQNIMLGDFGETYLLDWGLALRLDRLDEFPKGLVGTPSHMAPEMLSGNPEDVTPLTDVYLLGATLHKVLVGSTRHEPTEDSNVFDDVRVSKPHEYPGGVPEQLAELANQCCHPNPEERVQSATDFRHRLQDYLRHRHANELVQSGQREMEMVYELLDEEERSPLQRAQLYHHIHRARHGFEQALRIDSRLTGARAYLQKLVDDLTLMLLEEKNYEAACWFSESSGMLSKEVQDRLDAAIQSLMEDKMEAERLQSLGLSNDPASSRRSRMLLAAALCTCIPLAAYFIIHAYHAGPRLASKDLFIQSLFFLIPIGAIFWVARDKLISDPIGRRAAVGIVGGMIVLILHRWAGFQFDMAPGEVVTTEKFLIALAFANTPPALPSGMIIAIICILTGVLAIIYPPTMLIGSMIVVILIALFVGKDIYTEWFKKS